MGTEVFDMKPLVPHRSRAKAGRGRWTTAKPSGNWTAEGYDDSSWDEDVAAFGTQEERTDSQDAVGHT